MKVLLDTCVWGGVRLDLEIAGHDVIWSGDWESDPGDLIILTRAYNEGRILITLDKDFGELAILRGIPHCGIIRLFQISRKQQAAVSLEILARYGEELLAGSIVTVEQGRVRIRRA